MRRTALFLLACTIGILLYSAIAVNAQQPANIMPYSIEQRPIEWYKKQAALWSEKLNGDPGNAFAWYNLYYAKRLIMFHGANDKISERQKEIDEILKDAEQHIARSYEYNLMKWLVGGLDFNNLKYLLKADELGSGRTEHLTHMMNITELQGNASERNAYALRWKRADAVSPGMLNYNYNVLIGLDSNAILVTVGDNDTYPAWVLQALGIRNDVTVLNLSLLLDDNYRQRTFQNLGVSNIKLDWSKDPDNVEKVFQEKILGLLTANNNRLPVYLSLTASAITTISEPNIDDNLYLTGLAYRYSKTPIDNIGILRKNFELLYKLDYLDQPFYTDISAALVARINVNYTVPMTRLLDHYILSGDLQKEKWIKSKLAAINKPDEIH